MKSIDKLSNLADKFEERLAKYGQATTFSQSQVGTTELFFGDDNKQRAFNTAAQGGAIAKFLTETATKTQKTAGFELKATANPGKGAAWILATTPPTLRGTISNLLNTVYKSVTGKDMTSAQVAADKAAKSGSGSGTLNIASFSADMD